MATILKGAEVVEALNAEIIKEAEALRAEGIEPTLAILRVGERGDDISYEKGVTKRAEKVNVAIRNVILPVDVSQDDLVDAIENLNADSKVHGVLMFRPLPGHLDEDYVRNKLDPAKDIDGITDASTVGVFTGVNSGFAPCTPSACMEILEHFDVSIKGKNAVVVGRSLVVGKPAAMMLLERQATVTIAHSKTTDLPSVVRAADIVIACVGRAEMITADYLRTGQVVIDVGINVTEEGALVGDVDFSAAEGIVDFITPVPGGVGTVTTSVNLKHVVSAARNQNK
ncbi:MAG TPA: bifunctional 5,10-methylene-tetrahydrofolate dehydrogenase/5,10-methylene-tetrahydrofolate cyclohydrolase [Coriobacteriia bacterium]|nr:bifunctional 5,10-methylene-tetrahydrofolate dehydrogenase/5,10-methylene-tetrahydrofolate cyclohydrolase [Coriobacteriia bacterium]